LSQVLAEVWPFGHSSGHVFICARHQAARVGASTVAGLTSQQVVKFVCARAELAKAATAKRVE
jgi:hypothetical protein